jgi:hypothetical protein
MAICRDFIEPTRGLEPRTPSLREKGPPKAFYLQIATFVFPACVFYRWGTAHSFVFSRVRERSGSPSWAAASAPEKRHSAPVRHQLARAVANRLGGIGRSGSTSGHGSLPNQIDRTARSAQLDRSCGDARRVRAHAASLHRLRSHPLPPPARRALPDTRGGDRRVLGRARPRQAGAASRTGLDGPTPGAVATQHSEHAPPGYRTRGAGGLRPLPRAPGRDPRSVHHRLNPLRRNGASL